MNRKILSSTLVVVSLIAAVGGSAFALFRDTEYIPGNSISTGAVDIILTGESAQFPSPIEANNLSPGQWSDWSKVNVTNSSTGAVALYFYVTNVEGAACEATNLEIVAEGSMVEELGAATFDEEEEMTSGIYAYKGVDNKVLLSDPSLAVGAVAAFNTRAGLSEDASDDVMGKSCSWTGVFLAEPTTEEEEPPVSFPVSLPEELVIPL